MERGPQKDDLSTTPPMVFHVEVADARSGASLVRMLIVGLVLIVVGIPLVMLLA